MKTSQKINPILCGVRYKYLMDASYVCDDFPVAGVSNRKLKKASPSY